MNKYDIINKAWDEVSKFNSADEVNFNNSATSFKINDDYNLAVWCDTEYDSKKPFRHYVVSIRFNPEDDSFGKDIGAEYCTNNITKEDLEEAIEEVLNCNNFINNNKQIVF